MKLKKGSAAAKAYMAKIRSKRKTKKTKVSGVKKATFKPLIKKKAAKKAAKKTTSYHKDTKSHNVRVSVVSGISSAKTALLKQYENLQGRLLTLKKAVDKRKVKKQITSIKSKFNKLNKF